MEAELHFLELIDRGIENQKDTSRKLDTLNKQLQEIKEMVTAITSRLPAPTSPLHTPEVSNPSISSSKTTLKFDAPPDLAGSGNLMNDDDLLVDEVLEKDDDVLKHDEKRAPMGTITESNVGKRAADLVAHQVFEEMPETQQELKQAKLKDPEMTDLKNASLLLLIRSESAELINTLNALSTHEEIPACYIGNLCYDPGGGSWYPVSLSEASVGVHCHLNEASSDKEFVLGFRMNVVHKSEFCLDDCDASTLVYKLDFKVNHVNLAKELDGLKVVDFFVSTEYMRAICFDPGGVDQWVKFIARGIRQTKIEELIWLWGVKFDTGGNRLASCYPREYFLASDALWIPISLCGHNVFIEMITPAETYESRTGALLIEIYALKPKLLTVMQWTAGVHFLVECLVVVKGFMLGRVGAELDDTKNSITTFHVIVACQEPISVVVEMMWVKLFCQESVAQCKDVAANINLLQNFGRFLGCLTSHDVDLAPYTTILARVEAAEFYHSTTTFGHETEVSQGEKLPIVMEHTENLQHNGFAPSLVECPVIDNLFPCLNASIWLLDFRKVKFTWRLIDLHVAKLIFDLGGEWIMPREVMRYFTGFVFDPGEVFLRITIKAQLLVWFVKLPDAYFCPPRKATICLILMCCNVGNYSDVAQFINEDGIQDFLLRLTEKIDSLKILKMKQFDVVIQYARLRSVVVYGQQNVVPSSAICPLPGASSYGHLKFFFETICQPSTKARYVWGLHIIVFAADLSDLKRRGARILVFDSGGECSSLQNARILMITSFMELLFAFLLASTSALRTLIELFSLILEDKDPLKKGVLMQDFSLFLVMLSCILLDKPDLSGSLNFFYRTRFVPV